MLTGSWRMVHELEEEGGPEPAAGSGLLDQVGLGPWLDLGVAVGDDSRTGAQENRTFL